MPGPTPVRRLTPLKGRGSNQTLFRYLSRSSPTLFGSGNRGAIQWTFCQSNRTTGFRDAPNVHYTRGFYLSNSDLGLIGLAGAAIAGPLALAWTGVSSAYWMIGGAVVSSTNIAGALIGAGITGGLTGMIHPTYTQFSQPCKPKKVFK